MPKEFKSSFLAKIVEGEVNTKDIIVTNFASLKDANPSSICFFNDPKYKNELLETNAGIVLLQKADSSYYSGPAIFVKNPYLAFAKIATLFQDKIKKKYSSSYSFNW
jgi:UDP-3-O-[3-hydroxymyristoyl] glucosamine N-acyltransferase